MKQTVQKLLYSSLFILATTACNADLENQPNKIASIPEASGISYCSDSDTLMVANDEGSFYEITPKGEIITQHKLGNHDLEGVVCEKERIVFAVEGEGLLAVNRQSMEKKLLRLKGKKIKLSKKSGIEGLVKVGKHYYLSIQAKKKKDAMLLKVAATPDYAKVLKVIEHGVIDSAGLEYKGKKLYIVSDKKDTLYVYDLKREKVLKKIKLPKFAQEGIAFGKNDDVFFADDNGAVMKYSRKELGL
jgi:uncharacterized protein YjiK